MGRTSSQHVFCSLQRFTPCAATNEGADKFKTYRLELPEKLQFSDSRAKAEDKLGAAAEVKKNYTDLGMLYPVFGLQINYDTLSPDDLNVKFHHIVVENPEMKELEMRKTILLMGLSFSAALAAADCKVTQAGGGCLKGTCTDVFTVNGKKWAHDKDPGDRQANSRISEKIREACAAGGSEAAFRKRGFRTPTTGEY